MLWAALWNDYWICMWEHFIHLSSQLADIFSLADVNKHIFFWNSFTVCTLLFSGRSVLLSFFFLKEIPTFRKHLSLDKSQLCSSECRHNSNSCNTFPCFHLYYCTESKKKLQKKNIHTFVGFLYKTLLFECFRKVSAIRNRWKPKKCQNWHGFIQVSYESYMNHT